MAKDTLEGVSPTRMDLLQTRRRKALAVKGHQLLSEKRDALVASFFDLIRQRKEKRREMENSLRQAYLSLIRTEMTLGEKQTQRMAQQIKTDLVISVSTKNIMGVTIPAFTSEEQPMPHYNLMSTNASFDETVSRGLDALKKILGVATIEGNVQMLGREIEKTKRRVNALEYIFIPRLVATISYIERQLEEREREDFFRRKRIKALLEQHED